MAKIEIKDGKIFSENDYRTDVFEIPYKIPAVMLLTSLAHWCSRQPCFFLVFRQKSNHSSIPAVCSRLESYGFRSYADNVLSHDCGTSARCS